MAGGNGGDERSTAGPHRDSGDALARAPIESSDGLQLSDPKRWSAGLPGVLSSFEHILGKSGLRRGFFALKNLNQKGGYDCPSCAWPDPDAHRSMFEFCENGAKAVASEAMTGRLDASFFRAHSVVELAARPDAWHDAQGRLVEPLVLREGATHYESISWESAFALVAETLNELDSPNEAAFYTSGRASNEAAFLYGLFARAFGTNNLPDCSNMCHESSGVALGDAIGIGKGTVSVVDLESADVILCAGQNPGTNHPRMLATLDKAVRAGAHMVAINPLKEAGLVAFAHPQSPLGLLGKANPLAAEYLQVRVNGDQALFRGIAKALLALHGSDESVIDEVFVEEHTAGFDAYRELVEQTGWAQIETLSGIERATLEALARKIGSREKRLITCWAMGLTQHKNSVETLREVVNVHLLVGAIGRPGAGLCPVRGHSNVQGDRTVGIWEKMPESFLARLDEATGIKSPREEGLDTVGVIRAMHEGAVKVFMALGGNFLQASPDTDFVAAGLRKCELTVQVSTKLNRSHLVHGRRALILPCLGRTERDARPENDGGADQIVSCENSMGVVQSSAGRLEAASRELRSEVQIVCGIGAATLGDVGHVSWAELADDYDKVRTLIEAVVPGFEDYNVRVREPGGFYLPNGARDRVWDTASGKAEFEGAPLSAAQGREGHFVLQTVRSHDQFNTTIYGGNDRYRGITGGRRVVFMSPDDMRAHGLVALDAVDLTSHFGDHTREVKRFLVVPYDIPRGSLAAYFPEANPLVPIGSVALGSNTPTSKSIEVSVRASSA